LAETAKVFEKHIEDMEPYTDPSFMAEQSSLFNKDKIGEDSKMIAHEFTKVDQWVRPKEVILTTTSFFEPELFNSFGVQPNQVKEGRVSDNWLLSAAAALAEYPDRVKNLFKNKEYPKKSGIFEVNLFQQG